MPYEYLELDPKWLIFETAVDGTFVRAFGPRILARSACHQELIALGIDVSKSLKPSYTASVYEQAMKVLKKQLFASNTDEAAYRAMGAETCAGFYRTLVGSALAKIQPLIGPDRMLTRLPNSITNSSNFMRAEVEKRAPRDYKLHVWGTNTPWYVAGAVDYAVNQAGVKATVSVEELGRFEAWYGIKW